MQVEINIATPNDGSGAKVKVIPVIVGALGNMTLELEKWTTVHNNSTYYVVIKVYWQQIVIKLIIKKIMVKQKLQF